MPLFRLNILVICLLLAGCVSTSCQAQESNNSIQAKALANYILAVNSDLDGDSVSAISFYEQSLKYDNDAVAPRLRLGAYYARLGRFDEAIEHLKSISALPGHPQAHYLLALVYSSQNKFDLAVKEYESILKEASLQEPDNLEIRMYLAQLYYAKNNYQGSIEQFEKILLAKPQDIASLFWLGALYTEINDTSKAKEFYRRVLAIDPDHDGALNALSYVFAEENINLDEALKMVRRAIELDASNGAYYDTLGWVLFKKGLAAESLMALEKAATFLQDAIIYDHMGDVYFSVNEFSLARKFWRKSLDLKSDQPQVVKKISDLEKVHVQQFSPQKTP